ncbi:hypothetical protein Tco_1172026 [Tanacetum coccineum]
MLFIMLTWNGWQRSYTNVSTVVEINRGTGIDNQRAANVAGAMENVGTPVVQKSGIQCYNCKEYEHIMRLLLDTEGNYGPILMMNANADKSIGLDDTDDLDTRRDCACFL